MILSRMMAVGEDELICDLAETYHIYDYRSLSPRMAAVFSCGLRNNSRIKKKLSGREYDIDNTLLNVMIYDCVNWLRWTKTQAAHDGGDPPEPMLNKMLGYEDSSENTDVQTYDSAEEFEAARRRILEGGV